VLLRIATELPSTTATATTRSFTQTHRSVHDRLGPHADTRFGRHLQWCRDRTWLIHVLPLWLETHGVPRLSTHPISPSWSELDGRPAPRVDAWRCGQMRLIHGLPLRPETHGGPRPATRRICSIGVLCGHLVHTVDQGCSVYDSMGISISNSGGGVKMAAAPPGQTHYPQSLSSWWPSNHNSRPAPMPVLS
jgi:hypothetical protein